MSSYLVPRGEGKSEYVEKRSSFLGRVIKVESEDEARAYIAQVKKEHRDARHNCWCYIIKDGPERYSDDGEPQGTAGIPMLEIFRREKIVNVVCVVTRYFGGILLGAGGLFRAYTKAAHDALDDAGREEIVPKNIYRLVCPYPFAEKLKTELAGLLGEITGTEYAENVIFTVSVPEEAGESFTSGIYDISNGQIMPEKAET